MPDINQIVRDLYGEGWTATQPAAQTAWRTAAIPTEKSGMQPTGLFNVTITKPGAAPQVIQVQSDATDPGGYRLFEPPKEQVQPASVTVPGQQPQVVDVGGTKYTFDPTTRTFTPGPTAPSNPDEDISKAITAQTAEANRNARQRNLESHGFYVDDAQLAAISQAGQKIGIDQNQINAQLKIAADKNKLDEQALKNTERKTTSDIELQGAQAGRLSAQNAVDQASIDALKSKTPAEIDEMVARKQLTEAQAAQFRATTANLDRPQQIASDTTSQYRETFDPKTGKYNYQASQNYAPKETGAQIAALQQQALAKQNELNGLVQQGQMTGEAAAQQFNQWWDGTVEPRRMAIDEVQKQTQFENQIKLQQQQREAMATAQGAGTLAVQAYNAESKDIVGPGYEKAMQAILEGYKNKKAANVDASGLTWEAPSLQEISQQAVQKSLAGISPAASAANGQPGGGGLQVPPGMDLAAALDRTKYNSFGGAPGVTPPVPTPQPVAAGATVPTQTIPWQQTAPAAAPMIAGATPFMNANTTYYPDGGLPQEFPENDRSLNWPNYQYMGG